MTDEAFTAEPPQQSIDARLPITFWSDNGLQIAVSGFVLAYVLIDICTRFYIANYVK